MLFMESLDILGHSVTMSAKPTIKQIDIFLNYMKKRNIQTIVPLMPMEDIFRFYRFNLIELYEDSDFNVIHYPIHDFSTPKDLPAFDSFIKDAGNALKKSNILIHCSAGLGRTGLVSAALLIKYKQFSASKAVRVVRKSRMGTVETSEQESFLLKYDYYINGVQ